MTRVLPPVREMITRLVQLPSVSCHASAFDQGNLDVIEALECWASSLGFRTRVMRLPHHPRKANLIATLGEGEGGLLLAGHTDTVPLDEDRWTHDPVGAKEVNGKIYGLGTADMKSFWALALEAASAFTGPGALRAPLTLLATADEESTMAGAKALVRDDLPAPAYAVIGEPTSLRPIRAHKGIMMELVRILGRSGHSSNPALGANALEGMHKAIGALLDWRGQIQATHRDEAFAVPVPTMNLGRVEGGDNANRICAWCDLHLDVRLLPVMTREGVRRDLRKVLELAFEDSELRWQTEALFDGIPPLQTRADSTLVRAAESVSGQAAGTVAFGTEAPFLSSLGMETVVMGPGSIDQAHQPDEFLALSQIDPALDVLQGLIYQFCAS